MSRNQYERMDGGQKDDDEGGCCCCFKAAFLGSDAEKESDVFFSNYPQTPQQQQQQQLMLQQHMLQQQQLAQQQQLGHQQQLGQQQQTGAAVQGGRTSLNNANVPPGAVVYQVPPGQLQGVPGEPLTIPKVFVTDDPEDGTAKLGRIQFSIVYDFKLNTLTLKIIRAVNLVAKDFGGTSDPYVKVVLLPDKNTKLTTKIRKKNLNPRWNEVFAFEDYPYEKIIVTSLYIQVLDYDRFSKDDTIGELCIPLSDFDLATGQTLWKNLQPSEGSTGKLGELCLSLCYDSANSTIRVTVVKAAHLKAKDITGASDPYVKIWLIIDGKKTEKKRTSIKPKTLNPVFNETLTFQVSLDRIRGTSLLVAVMDFDRFGCNEPIGQLMLGSKSAPNEVKHWNEMFSNARQEVTQWHLLRDFG